MRIMNFTFSPYGEIIMNSFSCCEFRFFTILRKNTVFVYTNILILVQV